MLRDVLERKNKIMIKFHIEEYCENCPEFEIVQESLKSSDFTNGVYVEHHLSCLHAEKCREIKEYLKKGNVKNEVHRT